MSAPPYMKLFWGDYHKSTRHLTRSQHGAYFLLIGEAWRLGGALPDDDRLLAAWALCTAAEWDDIRPTVMAFFSLRRGRWVHDRVREELAHYESVSRKRKQAGRAGGSATNGKDTKNTEAIAAQLPTKPEPEPKPEVKREIERVGVAFAEFWLAYPRKVAKPAAAAAFKRALGRLREAGCHDPPATIIDGLKRARPSASEARYIPHPATWLNDNRWEDEPTDVRPLRPAKQSAYLDTLSDIDRAMEQARVNVEQRDRDTRDSFGPAAVG